MPSVSAEFIQRLAGISGILVTPFDGDDKIAPQRLQPILDRMLAAGVHLATVNGNTSEFYSLTLEEAENMVDAVCDLADGRMPVLAGVGRSVTDACRLAAVSARAGAAAIMVHQPPDPFASPRGLVEYVKRVAGAADGLPVVLYLRNDAIGTSAIADICAIAGVVGVKWASQNPQRLAEAIAAADPALIWVAGLAETWAPALYAVGARGFTSGLVNIWPERSMAIWHSLDGSDYAKARALIDDIKIFEVIRAAEMNGTNVTGVKAALLALGLNCGAARPPASWPMSRAHQVEMEHFLTTNGFDVRSLQG
ncbi:dihydrodipicolinate synthase family protein [Devosia sp.]|uniref:dihydrodipicolinate synthase family protein n=1 Tax=Devosia sp. TaxID=1871048 RepID=UPI002AFFB3FC|nr:dihydrodipicolinate synthase family protein [Devosia sp.]